MVVVTGAASGKTLCYNMPVLQSILTEQDEPRPVHLPHQGAGPGPAAQPDRADVAAPRSGARWPPLTATRRGRSALQAKRTAQIVLTNPDMLHLGILPNHQSWSRFLRRLKYVVIDEVHVYRGVFGSHVANVLRRLRRLWTATARSPSSSAARPPSPIPGSMSRGWWGCPSGWWTPTARRTAARTSSSGTRRCWRRPEPPASAPTARPPSCWPSWCSGGIRTIAFARTRKLTELIYVYARQRLGASPLAQRIKPYRGGYLAAGQAADRAGAVRRRAAWAWWPPPPWSWG